MSERETNVLPTPEQARSALADVERMREAGLARGLYPRWLAAVTSLWTGVIAALVAFDGPAANGLIVLIALAGIGALAWYRRRAGAWLLEMASRRDLALVLLGVLALLGLGLGGAIARELYGASWAPIASGSLAGLLLFGMMELGHRARRRPLAERDP